MQDFQVASVPLNRTIAAERLGLTDNERHLINLSNPNLTWQQLIWNAPGGDTDLLNFMKQVDHFLDKTGLTYKELNLLLSLKFIDPNPTVLNKKLFIKHNDPNLGNCDTAKKEIVHLDVAALDRIYRFLSLQKKTGWAYETLQEIINQSHLGNGLLDDAWLIHAAHLLQLSEKTGIKIAELMGFYGEIPYKAYTDSDAIPLYHQIFLNKAKNGFIDSLLLTDEIDGIHKLESVKTSLSVCLQLSEQDLHKLLASLPTNDLSFANLSALYAASKLMQKL